MRPNLYRNFPVWRPAELNKVAMLTHRLVGESSFNSLASSINGLQNKSKDIKVDTSESEIEEPLETDAEKKRPIVDVQTSIKYLASKAYKMTYGDALVWQPYRRNHKGSLPPQKTRKTCIRKGVISTGNPCPICRDEYLVLHRESLDLLKQFICPHTGKVISFQKTGLCQTQHNNLLIVIQQAWDYGYIDGAVPFRYYDYEEYYPQLQKTNGQLNGVNQKS